MVFGDVNEEVFIRVKLVSAKLALSFSPLTLRRQLHIFQIHAASLAGSTGLCMHRFLHTRRHCFTAHTYRGLAFTVICKGDRGRVTISLVAVFRAVF